MAKYDYSKNNSMIGRQQELAALETAYQKKFFQFLFVYGPLNVGKTTLLQEFARLHCVIFFSAQERNDALNLVSFSRAVQGYFGGHFSVPFANWHEAFTYIGNHADGERKVVLIIDDFPALLHQNPSIETVLCREIDQDWKKKDIFLILSAYTTRISKEEALSSLCDRITGKLDVGPFDYIDSDRFFPRYSRQEQLLAYGILGGIPRYLVAFDDTRTIEENIIEKILAPNAFLHDEIQQLLRIHLRDLGVYNSILEAIANGDNRVTRIASRIHESRNKCGRYLQKLQDIHMIRKIVPCGQLETSKKGIYILTEFYYTLPFVPRQIGPWWGMNPLTMSKDDMDLVAIDKTGIWLYPARHCAGRERKKRVVDNR